MMRAAADQQLDFLPITGLAGSSAAAPGGDLPDELVRGLELVSYGSDSIGAFRQAAWRLAPTIAASDARHRPARRHGPCARRCLFWRQY
jgi:hypothetical protein